MSRTLLSFFVNSLVKAYHQFLAYLFDRLMAMFAIAHLVMKEYIVNMRLMNALVIPA